MIAAVFPEGWSEDLADGLALAGVTSIFFGRELVDLYLSLLAWP